MRPNDLTEAKDSLLKASRHKRGLESKPGPNDNWVERAGAGGRGQLPAYIQHVALAIHRERGVPKSQAIAMAIGTIKRWAAGGGNVDTNTRAAAAKAVAEWEALKAKSRAKSLKEAAARGRGGAKIQGADAGRGAGGGEFDERKVKRTAKGRVGGGQFASKGGAGRPQGRAGAIKVARPVKKRPAHATPGGPGSYAKGFAPDPKWTPEKKKAKGKGTGTKGGGEGAANVGGPDDLQRRYGDVDAPEKKGGSVASGSGKSSRSGREGSGAGRSGSGSGGKGSSSLRKGAGMDSKWGDSQVSALQAILTEIGVDFGGVDGKFGPQTERAIKELQRQHGLDADGVVGPKTNRLLARLARAEARERAAQRPKSARTAKKGRLRESNDSALESEFARILGPMNSRDVVAARARARIEAQRLEEAPLRSLRGRARDVVKIRRLPDGTFAPKGLGRVLEPGTKVELSRGLRREPAQGMVDRAGIVRFSDPSERPGEVASRVRRRAELATEMSDRSGYADPGVKTVDAMKAAADHPRKLRMEKDWLAASDIRRRLGDAGFEVDVDADGVVTAGVSAEPDAVEISIGEGGVPDIREWHLYDEGKAAAEKIKALLADYAAPSFTDEAFADGLVKPGDFVPMDDARGGVVRIKTVDPDKRLVTTDKSTEPLTFDELFPTVASTREPSVHPDQMELYEPLDSGGSPGSVQLYPADIRSIKVGEVLEDQGKPKTVKAVGDAGVTFTDGTIAPVTDLARPGIADQGVGRRQAGRLTLNARSYKDWMSVLRVAPPSDAPGDLTPGQIDQIEKLVGDPDDREAMGSLRTVTVAPVDANTWFAKVEASGDARFGKLIRRSGSVLPTGEVGDRVAYVRDDTQGLGSGVIVGRGAGGSAFVKDDSNGISYRTEDFELEGTPDGRSDPGVSGPAGGAPRYDVMSAGELRATKSDLLGQLARTTIPERRGKLQAQIRAVNAKLAAFG